MSDLDCILKQIIKMREEVKKCPFTNKTFASGYIACLCEIQEWIEHLQTSEQKEVDNNENPIQ